MNGYRTFLSNNIRKLRTESGVSQESLADKLGVSLATYAYYESGKTEPDLETAVKLAKALGVSVEKLIVPEE